MTQQVLITGGQGFVGQALVCGALKQGLRVRVTSRRSIASNDHRLEHCQTGDIGLATDWRLALHDVNTVVHCAARAHVMRDAASSPLDAFREVNFHGTLNLARQAAEAGIRRFVFISSIGVNGGETFGTPFTAADLAAPHSPYAVSKHEAELGLRQLSDKTGMEVVIVRPPLVYGPDAPGNFGTLVKWLLRGIPLPLGAVNNRRSYVALDNLVDLLLRCIDHPAAANQTFLVSDDEDLSTTDLLRRMGQALGRPARLLPVPSAMLKLGATLLGKPELAQRLCGSLQLDISKTRQVLGWTPPLSVDKGLQNAAKGYLV